MQHTSWICQKTSPLTNNNNNNNNNNLLSNKVIIEPPELAFQSFPSSERIHGERSEAIGKKGTRQLMPSWCHLDANKHHEHHKFQFNKKKHTHVPIYAQKQFFSLFFQNSRSFWGSLACLKKSWILSVGQSFSNYQTWIHIFYFLFCKKKSLPNTMIRDYVTAAVPKTPQKHGPFNWS